MCPTSDEEETDSVGQSSDVEETDADLYFRTFAAVEKDNKHEFVRLFNRLSPDYKETIILAIAGFDSPNCLAAIFDGEAGDGDESLITHYVSVIEKNIPLHSAARGATFGKASLLLDRGFSADLRTDYDSPFISLKNALPLNVAIDYSRFHIWRFQRTGNRFLSPIHQIIYLSRMTPHNKTIRLLARNTKEIKHEFFKYLKQGKVYEVGALLAIASDLIMSSSSTIDGENGLIGFKNIMEMRQFVLAEMSRSLGASDTQLKDTKKTLRLLEIFDRVGDKLLAHMPMWDNYTNHSGFKVASLIEDAAYDEEKEVDYDPDTVPSAYYTFLPCRPIPSSDGTALPYVIKSPTVTLSGGQFPNCTRKFSTKVHFRSWLEEGNSHVYVSLPLPITVKGGAVTQHVLSKKHASFTRAFAKAIRHIRYR